MTMNDPFAAASAAGSGNRFYFGQVNVEAEFVALVKGQGKVPFDENSHKSDDRRTSVRFIFNPIDAMNLSFLIDRDLIAESRTWSKIVWPSLKACDITNLRQIEGKYAKVELVPTGRTWQGRNGTMEETTLKFHAIYDTADACTAAYGVETAQTLDDMSPDDDPAMDVDMSPQPTSNGAGNNAQKATAAAFLPALVNQANGDMNELASLLAQAPIVKDFFTVDSPEVQALLQAVPA